MENLMFKIKPLSGKYYETEILGPDGEKILVYHRGDRYPSSRQLFYWDMTHRQFDTDPDQDSLTCDGHYETSDTFYLAEQIVESLNYKIRTAF